MRPATAALAALATLLIIAACAASPPRAASSPSESLIVGIDPAVRPSVTLDWRRGCPDALNGARDAANSDQRLTKQLLLPGSIDAALICSYGVGPTGSRLAARRLGVAEATRLADSVSRIRLGVSAAPASCPGNGGTTDLIGFRYTSGATETLWYRAGGCESVDNGFVQAGVIANPSFGRFASLVHRLAPCDTSSSYPRITRTC